MKTTLKYFAVALLAGTMSLAAGLAAHAATYYVDFSGGSDTASGLAQNAAWKHLPGTSGVSGTSWKSIAAGDTIFLKPGTTHTGGQIVINSSWYGNGTASSPITIKADTTWGSGQIVIEGSGASISTGNGLVDVSRNYIVMDGVTTSGIKIQNSKSYGYFNSASYGTVRNMEVYNSSMANVAFVSLSRPSFIQGGTVDSVIAHKTNTNDDWAGNILFVYVNGGLITDSVGYDGYTGSDGIHLGSCTNTWVVGCTTYNNGEQGIDVSKDGDYKTRDDSWNITVKDCSSYNNAKMNYDANSSSRDIYFINNIGWKTTESEKGDANFMAYEGGNRIFFINCTSSGGNDMGYGFAWWSEYYNLGTGTYTSYIINSISSGDNGKSVTVESDYSGRSFAIQYINSDLNSGSGTPVTDKSTSYTTANITSKSGGWPGTACLSTDPLFTAVGSTWAATDLSLKPSSPCVNAGAFPFTASAAGSGTTITLSKLVSDLDVRQVFMPGDTVQIQGAGKYTVASVGASNQITFTASATWAAGAGVWIPWPNTKPDMGAMPTNLPTAPTGFKIVQ